MALSNLTKVQTLGIGSNIEVVGVITTGQFKSGTSNLHSTGVELTNLNVSGIATIGGSISIGGTLTYQDVTNIDSVGIITARSNIDCNGDLDVDGHTELDNVNIAGVATFSQGGSEVVRINSGGLLLYNDLSFFGASTHAYWDRSANQFLLSDNTKLSVGSSSDLQIFHDGTANNNVISGHLNSLNIRNYDTNSTDINLSARNDILLQTAINESAIWCDANAGVHIYYNGAQKFVTTNTGAVISGICTATSFSGDGSNLTGITGTTINSNADNRVITGSGTANTLNAESTFTHDPVNCDTQIIHNSNNVADLLVQNTGSGTAAVARLTLHAGSNANSGCQLGLIVGSHAWYLETPKNAGHLNFMKGSQKFRMAENGNFDISDGDLVIGTAGHGIDFSADGNGTLKSLPNSFNAELLHDYENGTFTPNIQYDTGTNRYAGGNVSSAVGEYIRIGDLVNFGMKITLTSNQNHTENTHIYIGGLPYNGMHSSQQSSMQNGWGGWACPTNDNNFSYDVRYCFHGYTTVNLGFSQSSGNGGISGFYVWGFYRTAP